MDLYSASLNEQTVSLSNTNANAAQQQEQIEVMRALHNGASQVEAEQVYGTAKLKAEFGEAKNGWNPYQVDQPTKQNVLQLDQQIERLAAINLKLRNKLTDLNLRLKNTIEIAQTRQMGEEKRIVNNRQVGTEAVSISPQNLNKDIRKVNKSVTLQKGSLIQKSIKNNKGSTENRNESQSAYQAKRAEFNLIQRQLADHAREIEKLRQIKKQMSGPERLLQLEVDLKDKKDQKLQLQKKIKDLERTGKAHALALAKFSKREEEREGSFALRNSSPTDLNGLIEERILGNGPQNSVNAKTAALVNELRVWKEKVARLEQQKERDEMARKSQMVQIVKMKEQNRKAMGDIESGLKRRQSKAIAAATLMMMKQRSVSPQIAARDGNYNSKNLTKEKSPKRTQYSSSNQRAGFIQENASPSILVEAKRQRELQLKSLEQQKVTLTEKLETTQKQQKAEVNSMNRFLKETEENLARLQRETKEKEQENRINQLKLKEYRRMLNVDSLAPHRNQQKSQLFSLTQSQNNPATTSNFERQRVSNTNQRALPPIQLKSVDFGNSSKQYQYHHHHHLVGKESNKYMQHEQQQVDRVNRKLEASQSAVKIQESGLFNESNSHQKNTNNPYQNRKQMPTRNNDNNNNNPLIRPNSQLSISSNGEGARAGAGNETSFMITQMH